MRKLFISQPMNGLTDKEILEERERIVKYVENITGEKFEVIESFIPMSREDSIKNMSVWYLGRSIQFLSEADVVFFGKDWFKSRGCSIEHKIAEEYKLNIIQEY